MQNRRPAQVYPTIEAFYSENEARRRSPEADFGCWWLDDRQPGCCQISYVKATGEVYAVHIRGRAAVEVLGVVPPDPEEYTPGGNRISRLTYYRTLDRILKGWSEHCGTRGGLVWVRAKLASAGEQLSQWEG